MPNDQQRVNSEFRFYRQHVVMSDVQSHRRLLNWFRLYYRAHQSILGLSPLSHKIIQSVSSLSFVPTFLLAWSLCRVNELHQIDVQGLKSFERILLISSKGGHERYLAPFQKFKLPLLRSVPDNTCINILSYDALARQIKSARIRNNIELPGNQLDCTHIFRHIEASWAFHLGIPIDDISYMLGHKMNETTRKYIHDIY